MKTLLQNFKNYNEELKKSNEKLKKLKNLRTFYYDQINFYKKGILEKTEEKEAFDILQKEITDEQNQIAELTTQQDEIGGQINELQTAIGALQKDIDESDIETLTFGDLESLLRSIDSKKTKRLQKKSRRLKDIKTRTEEINFRELKEKLLSSRKTTETQK